MALIQCPECTGKVSDRAIQCPHCGCPISSRSKSGGRPKKSHTPAGMKLPNGFGSISFLGSNRRNPYYARKTVGKNENGRYIQKPIEPQASFPTYNDAYQALMEYNKAPWQAVFDTTFTDAYAQWSEKYFVENNLSDGRRKAYYYAHKGCESIHTRKLHDLTTADYEIVLQNSCKSEIIKIDMRALMINLCTWGMKYGIIDRNHAELTDPISRPDAVIVRMIFSGAEVEKLWSLAQSTIADMTLVSIYCGLRPAEVCRLKIEDINLEEQYMVGGVKTEAGIRRMIPIHNDIVEIVKRNMHSRTGPLFLYKEKEWKPKTHQYHFKKFMQSVSMEHYPHDCRHTFVTRAKKCEINEFCLKLIVGHSISDITEKIYTHRTPEELLEEANKVTFMNY